MTNDKGKEYRLLVISCTEKKAKTEGEIAAIHRYDGLTFQILRKYLRENPVESSSLEVLVLSAEFGLISAQQPIPYYDRLMTKDRANELRNSVNQQLQIIYKTRSYTGTCLALSKLYMQALDEKAYSQIDGASLTLVNGSQGRRLSQLYAWLWGQSAAIQTDDGRTLVVTNSATLKGIQLSYTAEEVVYLAEQALQSDGHNAHRFINWYVNINGQKISPKWVVGKISGLSVSEYTTGEAIRVLHRLGIETFNLQK